MGVDYVVFVMISLVVCDCGWFDLYWFVECLGDW